MEQKKMNSYDYPLAKKRADVIKTPTGKGLQEITLENVINGEIKPEDVRISPETLEMQAQIAEDMNRDAIARNFRRAAGLRTFPDDRIMEIYNALRPYRSTKEELLAIADEVENVYGAKVNAEFIREASEVYEERKKLRQE